MRLSALRLFEQRIYNNVLENMKTTYIKCSHGVELRSLIPCKKCETENLDIFKAIAMAIKTDTRIPMYRGCGNTQCNCTGRCKEIIGYQEPTQHKEIDEQTN